jgi:hypothetical protein
MRESDILFTEQELKIVNSKAILLSKHSATHKIRLLLEQTAKHIDQYIAAETPHWYESINWQGLKVSRGENYNGLPYQVLDHPRYFHSKDVLAFRVMCWWGNYFCHTLHISGKFLQVNKMRYLQNLGGLKNRGLFLGINKDPWKYEFNQQHYRALSTLSDQQIQQSIEQTGHLKISAQFPLDRWKELPSITVDRLRLFFRLLD